MFLTLCRGRTPTLYFYLIAKLLLHCRSIAHQRPSLPTNCFFPFNLWHHLACPGAVRLYPRCLDGSHCGGGDRSDGQPASQLLQQHHGTRTQRRDTSGEAVPGKGNVIFIPRLALAFSRSQIVGIPKLLKQINVQVPPQSKCLYKKHSFIYFQSFSFWLFQRVLVFPASGFHFGSLLTWRESS